MFKIFYSWQSDLPSSTNRSLILTALQRACTGLKSEAGLAVDPVVERDTLGLAGAPDISDAIFSKIREADMFVADVSLVNSYPNSASGPNAVIDKAQYRPTPNPNVLVELGYALAMLGNEAVVLAINTRFGGIDQLPFDLRSLRVMKYSLSPEDERTAVRKELEQDFKAAIQRIAGVVRSDPVHQIIYPRTLNVAGQAEGMLRDLIKAAGKPFDPESITESELNEVCALVDPNEQAPLIVGGDPVQGWQYANWITCMYYWRDRSRSFNSDILVFSQFLSREHIALLATIEQCSYFAQLEDLRGRRVNNTNLSWLSSSIWSYLSVTRQLKDYAIKVISRRAKVL